MRSELQRSRGFTLIEIMIVIVIVAILSAVALPAYQNSILKGRRSDAMSSLADAANRQQQLMLDRSTYTADMMDLGFSANPLISEKNHYSIAAVACSGGTIANCYVLTATPRASSPQSKDVYCTSLSLASDGERTATGTQQDQCW